MPSGEAQPRDFIPGFLFATDMLSHVCHCHTYHVFGVVLVDTERPSLPIAWCDYFLSDSTPYWANFLKINTKMAFLEIMLVERIANFTDSHNDIT